MKLKHRQTKNTRSRWINSRQGRYLDTDGIPSFPKELCLVEIGQMGDLLKAIKPEF